MRRPCRAVFTAARPIRICCAEAKRHSRFWRRNGPRPVPSTGGGSTVKPRLPRFKGLLRSEFRQPGFLGTLPVPGVPSLQEGAAYLSPSMHLEHIPIIIGQARSGAQVAFPHLPLSLRRTSGAPKWRARRLGAFHRSSPFFNANPLSSSSTCRNSGRSCPCGVSG